MAARLPSARKSRKTHAPAVSAPPRAAVPGDNARAAEEQERVQLISFVNRLTDADDKVTEAEAPLKLAKAHRTLVIKTAEAAGFTKTELRKRQEEMGRSTLQNAHEAAREARHRRWLGILTPEQQTMHLGDETPEEVRDEDYWKTEGFKTGMRNRPAVAPEGMPTRYLQAFLRGHEMGFKDYMLTLAQNVPKPKGVTAQEVAAQAEAHYKADNPEIDVEAEAAKLKKAGFLNRDGPVVGDDAAGGEDAVDAGGCAPPVVVGEAPAASIPEGASTNSGPDDGFEATPEELAAQTTRQAIQDAREGNTTGGEVL